MSAEAALGGAPGRPSFVLGRVPAVVALLQGRGRFLDALLGIQSSFGRELSQPGLAIEESLRLVHPAAIPCQLRPEHRGDRAWELDSDNVFAVLGCAYAIGQSLGAALELDHFGT